MATYWAVILLGVLEGLTEFLPVSSTAHLLIAEHWLGQHSEAFNIIIQLGAVLAVVLVYRKEIPLLFTQSSSRRGLAYLGKIGVAFLATSVLGLLVKKMGWKLPTELWPIILALLAGSLAILLVEHRFQRNPVHEDGIGWTTALWVGIAQVFAGIFPGLSRSAATILTAVYFGVTRLEATEFSFLLGIPTMAAASLYSLDSETHFFHRAPAESWACLALGFFVSALVGFVSVKWLLSYVRSRSFVPFAWYRIALALVLLLVLRG
ncbi:undecaprenyl-diphosphate phosphatase [Candidatus Methylacidithermus pantelleriae]|nr:undecaprenyl-diphosphate phosphatase [Candidatus Methylacidithermus pantelleriae]